MRINNSLPTRNQELHILSVSKHEEISKTPVRDATVDMVKAICIILMVIGHGCCGELLHKFIYWFHMPCFFFITGWLLKDKYIHNPKLGIVSKFKGIYIPCIKWSIIFILLHNLFVPLRINSSYNTFSETVHEILRVVTFRPTKELLIGPYWFLITSLFASCYSIVYLYILSRFNRLNVKWIVVGILIFIGLTFISDISPMLLAPLWFKTAFYASAFMISGYLVHSFCNGSKYKIRGKYMLLLLIPIIF